MKNKFLNYKKCVYYFAIRTQLQNAHKPEESGIIMEIEKVSKGQWEIHNN